MINIRMQHTEVHKLSPKIIVLGVGGAGGNAVNNMITSGLQGVEFLVCNTDAQALESSLCEKKIQLGVTVTGGLGAGARPETGRAAAEESLDDVMQYLEGANMAFITAGMGGGTGTGAAPVIARACREKGVLTVGVVTKPFHFEGSYRMKMAEDGIRAMQEHVDTLIVIPNQNLFRIANEKTTFAEAFKMADGVLQAGVRGVTDLMIMPGLINLDFADIRSVMQEMGKAMMGTGEAVGDRRAVEAAEKAVNNPLLDDVSMKGARGVIINVTGGLDMTLFEVDEACNRIRDEVDPNANIIFGSTFDEAMEGQMRVSIVATGIESAEAKGRGKPPLSNATLNNLTVQQRMERAVPNTAEAQAAVSAAAPVAAQAAMVRPATPPASMRTAAAHAVGGYTAAAEAVRRMAAPVEVDMFEQQELMMAAQQAKKPESAAVAGVGLRGAVYNDSFIPPQPIEVEAPRMGESGYGPQFSTGLTATRPAHTQTTAAEGSRYVLQPPVPGASAQQKKRTPSIFDRFTHPRRHQGADEEENGGDTSASGAASSSSSGGGFGFRPAQRPLQQGTLGIEAQAVAVRTESAVAAQESELDIPAFLRRQAN